MMPRMMHQPVEDTGADSTFAAPEEQNCSETIQRSPKVTPSWYVPFIEALAATANVSAACRAAGIDRATYYNNRRQYPTFRLACRMALEISTDPIEASARDRAINGVTTYVLGKKDNVVWIWVDADGNPIPKPRAKKAAPAGARQVPMTETKYSDNLAKYLLEVHRYRPRREAKAAKLKAAEQQPIEVNVSNTNVNENTNVSLDLLKILEEQDAVFTRLAREKVLAAEAAAANVAGELAESPEDEHKEVP